MRRSRAQHLRHADAHGAARLPPAGACSRQVKPSPWPSHDRSRGQVERGQVKSQGARAASSSRPVTESSQLNSTQLKGPRQGKPPRGLLLRTRSSPDDVNAPARVVAMHAVVMCVLPCVSSAAAAPKRAVRRDERSPKTTPSCFSGYVWANCLRRDGPKS